MNVSKITYLVNNNIALTTTSVCPNKSFPQNILSMKDSSLNISIFHQNLMPKKDFKRNRVRGCTVFVPNELSEDSV